MPSINHQQKPKVTLRYAGAIVKKFDTRALPLCLNQSLSPFPTGLAAPHGRWQIGPVAALAISCGWCKLFRQPSGKQGWRVQEFSLVLGS
jgi:hypothetical protein